MEFKNGTSRRPGERTRLLGGLVVSACALFTIISACDSASDPTAMQPTDTRAAILTIEPESPEITEGSSLKLRAFFGGNDGTKWEATRGVRWTSDDPQVASVSADGRLTGVGRGAARIRVEVDQFQAETTAEILPDVAQLELLDEVNLVAEAGATVGDSIGVQVLDSNGSPVEGVAVSFTVLQGEGTASPEVASTGSDGSAQTRWQLGTAPGEHSLQIAVFSEAPAGGAGSASMRDGTGAAEPLADTTLVVTAGPGEAASLTVDPPSLALGLGSGAFLDVEATDEFGNPVPNADVQWTSSDSTVAVATNTSQPFRAALRTSSIGEATLTARVDDASATVEVVVQAPDFTLTRTGGNQQTGTVGQTLENVVQVQVTDSTGAGVEGIRVDWNVTSGDGSSGTAHPETDAGGFAEASWTLGSEAGTQTLSADVAGVGSVTFSATAEPGPVDSVAVSPASGTLDAGQSLQLSATIRDEYGNEITGTEPEWSSSSPGVASVNASGLVSAQGEGSAQITAAAGGASGSAQITVEPDLTVTLEKTGGDGQTGTVASALAQSLQVRVTDASGSGLEGVAVAWSVTGGGGSLSADTTETDGSGTAQVSWTLGPTAGNQTVTASAPEAGTVGFTATAEAGDVASVQVSPSGVSIDEGEVTELTASAMDAHGNPVSDASFTWTSGDTTVATVAEPGIVTGVSEGSTVVVAASGEVADSAEVTVTVPSESEHVLSITGGNEQTGSIGTPLPDALQVQVTDDTGAGVAGVMVSWSISSGGGSLSSDATETGSSGFAQVTWTLGEAGSQLAKATLESGQSVSFTATAYEDPQAVVDLQAASTTDTSAALTFTEVDDGSGNPADYEIRFHPTPIGENWDQATSVQEGSCATPVEGAEIGAERTCTVAGLDPSTEYDFQMVAFRGTLGEDPVLSALSNVVTATTADPPAPEPASVEVSPQSASLSDVGQTVQLSATALDDQGDPISDVDFAWSSLDPAVATVSPEGLVTAEQAGTALIVATATCCALADTAEVVVAQEEAPSEITLPELPREFIRWSPPAVTGQTIHVGPSDDLQAAINSAQPGDEIVVDPDGEWNSTITLPPRDDDGWITIRADANLPPYGERIGPDIKLPRINLVNNSGIRVPSNTQGWWMTGLEVYVTEGSYNEGVTIDGAERIVWDRGRVVSPDFGHEVRRGIRPNGAWIEIIGSRVEGVHQMNSESQAIALWDGPGPLRVHNNFLEAASIGFITGGAVPNVAHPADQEFTNNHVYRRPSWFGVSGMVVKNLFETKDVKRTLVEGNIFENNWPQGQNGFFAVLKSVEPNAQPCATCGSVDITFRLNKVINTVKGFNLARDPVGDPVPMQRVLIEDVIIDRWGKDSDFWESGTVQLFQLLRGMDNMILRRISGMNVEQNSTAIEYLGSDELGKGLEITSFRTGPTSFGVRGDGGDTLDDMYEASPRVFNDLYAVENDKGKCPDSTQDPNFAAEYFCVASPVNIPSSVGAAESAVDQAIAGVADPDLPQ